jgi:uncharacterized protein (DUF1800 family)
MVGGQFQFKATLTNLTGPVEWALVGTGAIGTIDAASGLYKAPSAVPNPNTLTVQATAMGTTATANFLVRQKPVTMDSWTPWSLPAGPFTLQVSGTNLTPTTYVTLGTIPVTTTYLSQYYLKVTGTIPANASGSVPISVTQPGLGGNTSTSPYQVPIGSGTGGGGGGGGTPSITVTPATVTLVKNSQQTFSAQLTNLTGAVTWTASAGTITSAGVFTAPSAPATVTVTATNAGTSGTATVTVVDSFAQPTVTSLSPTALPLGPYSLTINGTGFTAGAQVTIGGQPAYTTFVSAQQLTCMGVTLAAQQGNTASLTVTNGAPGNLVSTPVTVAIGVQNPQVSAAAAMRFLEQAGFGPRPADVMQVQQLGFQGWLAQQYAAPAGTLYSAPGGGVVNSMSARFTTNAVMGNNQLRQKVAFALSQLFVVSLNKLFYSTQMAPYQEMLYANAFTTYPNLLNKVTLDPAMGVFLDMVNNDKANPAAGSVANENYAREVMQLFSIGTNQLNLDGSLVIANGSPVPTYDQTTVQNFAKVFTGWTFGQTPGQSSYFPNHTYFLSPMIAFDAHHDMTAKTLLNGTILPAGQSAVQDMNAALANIAAHPNVAPFISRYLIQHLVRSNPSPAYIQRVATVFNDNGLGVKGDMQAVITAILLDAEARAGDNGSAQLSTFGHLQEPVLFLSSVLRAVNGTVDDSNYFSWDLFNMGQDLFNAASVFNYYSPQFHVGANLGPEFQIQSPWAAVYRVNFMDGLFGAYSGTQATYGPGTTVDLSPWMSLANNPAALVDALDSTFTHGQMPATMKSNIVTAVTGTSQGNLRRVQVGIYLIVTSSFYQVMH